MSVARRPLLTATAAGTLLCALWFVPSANATVERGGAGPAERSVTPAPSSAQPLSLEASSAGTGDGTGPGDGTGTGTEPGDGASAAGEVSEVGDGATTGTTMGTSGTEPLSEPGPDELRLADTGGVDTMPYLLGGTLSLGIGVAFVTYSLRKSATTL
ncbi:hypothetical protein AB0O07_16490 [Streptomyces sp. NPDC093085]|uniref:hypothetical protein n=1 Tax=Streptomyces sp. NPDC093085 TaxID=3155068 RepID=UPI00341EF7E0